jgi:hypothetical protein
MGNRLNISILSVAALLAMPPLLVAQNVGNPGPPTADLSGVWEPADTGNNRDVIHFTWEQPEMLAWAAERYKEVRKGQGEARPDYGRPDMDPSQYPYCMPFGMPRVFAYHDSFEIDQSPKRVYIFFESNAVQRIYTDGRKHLEGPPLTFMGQSIGRWEKDTLVVETVDMSDQTWIDGVGHPHTDALRVEQRIRRLDKDTLEISFLFDDPKTYTKPWGGKKVYKLRPRKESIMEYFLCEDRMREDFSQKVLGKKEGQ